MLHKEYCKVCKTLKKTLNEFTDSELDMYMCIIFTDYEYEMGFNVYFCINCETVDVLCKCTNYCRYLGNTSAFCENKEKISKHFDITKYKYVYRINDSVTISNKIHSGKYSILSEDCTFSDLLPNSKYDVYPYIGDDPINNKDYDESCNDLTVLLDDDDLYKYSGEFDYYKEYAGGYTLFYKGYQDIYVMSFKEFSNGFGGDGGFYNIYKCDICDNILHICDK